jgi:hypothetical protein
MPTISGQPVDGSARRGNVAREVKRWASRTVYLAQGGAAALSWHTGAPPSLATLGLVALVVCIPVAAAVMIVLGAGWSRRVLRRRRRGEAELRAATRLEASARARMSELCPHGWRAQVTLFAPSDIPPEGAPDGDRGRVALDWAELDDDFGHVAVVRRVWGATISEALEAMVADRRTDETLEQIERRARAWPEG